MVIRTELEWSYQPQGFFEERFMLALSDGELVADYGKATLTLAVPTTPISAADLQRMEKQVSGVFEVRQLIAHRSFELNVPITVQHNSDGTGDILVSITETVCAVDHADAIITNANGNIVRDRKAERLASEMKMIASLSSKLVSSSVLSGMVSSYGQAVRDPQNELVHLYEIRDAIAELYGGEHGAKKVLGITSTDWKALGRLANNEPLREGRHRGQTIGELRSATQEELEDARRIASNLIKAYAEKV